MLQQRTQSRFIGVPRVGGRVAMFPRSDAWNRRVDHLPVDSAVTAQWAAVTSGGMTHMATTTDNYPTAGMPINVVPSTQALVNITIDEYPGVSDSGTGVPFPPRTQVHVQGHAFGDPLTTSNDSHLLVVQQGSRMLHESWKTRFNDSTGKYTVGSYARWDTRKDSYGQRGLNKGAADAVGMPMMPGVIRAEEVYVDGEIKHAMRMAVRCMDWNYVYPANASAQAGECDTESRIYGGRHVRLKASYDDSGFSPAMKVITTALKRYGAIITDGNWVPDPNDRNIVLYASGLDYHLWDQNNEEYFSIWSIPASAYEAVVFTK